MKYTLKIVMSVSTLALLANSSLALAEPSADLIAAAKNEGELTTIALTRDWCGYGELIDGFSKKYGIRVNELNPNAASGDEVEAIKANKNNKGKMAPDVIDVGLPFGASAKAEGLLEPYKVSTWASIPDSAKDPEGYWYGDYYGVLSFEINKDLIKTIPTDWKDLLNPEYAHTIALDGDPRVGNQAIMAVAASGLSTETDVEKAAEAGLKFFAELNKRGNFVPTLGKAAPLAQGTTPIVIHWDYLALQDRDTLKGNPPVEIVVPKTGVVAGVYVQGISAYAPHPNAAKLWMEYIYSDEGQIGYLKGYCHPIRFNDLVTNNKVPQELLDKLPPAEAYRKAIFPSLADQTKFKDIITKKWDSVVGANVQ